MFTFLLAVFALSSAVELVPPPGVPPGWVVFDPMTDDFNGNSLDESKWYPYNPNWLGRQPGLFVASNVKVSNGNLQLWCQGGVTLNASMQAKGYNNYTTSAVKSKKFIKYGYSEIRAKSGNSKITSSFWFNYHDGSTEWTEIDVFENTGPEDNTAYNYDSMSSHTHIFEYPNTNFNDLPQKCNCTIDNTGSSCIQQNSYTPNFDNFSDDFHIFGMLWTDDLLELSLDGVTVWNITNDCCHQQLQLNFDRETWTWLPGGLPPYNELPDNPFEIDYVHTWVPPN